MAFKVIRFLISTFVILTIVFFFTLIGCSSPQAPDSNQSSSTSGLLTSQRGKTDVLDKELYSLLVAHAGGNDLGYFTFPKQSELDLIPQDPKNPLTRKKIQLGQLLYHETALGVGNLLPEGAETYSCASCHFAQAGFMANLPQGISEGGIGFGISGEARTINPDYDGDPCYPDCQPIRTPTVLNGAYQDLMLWNGQFGGIGDNLGTEDRWAPGTPLESNFLGLYGLETQAHGGLLAHRMIDVGLSRVAAIPRYQAMFRLVFPNDPDPVNRLNTALAIAAYERTVLASDAPFQKWLRGNKNAMSAEEKRGAVLFFGKAECVACHTGPALNSMTFYALGMSDLDGSYDNRVILDPFGGTIPENTRKGRGGFTGRAEDNYKFKTPQLYNLTDSPFLGHGASFATLREVVEYKNAAIPQNGIVPESQIAADFHPLGLTEDEINDLVTFLEGALHDGKLMRYVPRRIPSGNCFPVNDPQAQIDLDCQPWVARHQ